MAIIDLNTLDIYNTMVYEDLDDLEDLENDDRYIYVDDLIAPVIKELLSKGYITNFCCSGHAYYPNADYDENCFYEDRPWVSAYITFRPGIELPSHPKNAELEIDDLFGEIRYTIRYMRMLKRYDDYEYTNNKIMKCMKKWLRWAKKLPIYNNDCEDLQY